MLPSHKSKDRSIDNNSSLWIKPQWFLLYETFTNVPPTALCMEWTSCGLSEEFWCSRDALHHHQVMLKQCRLFWISWRYDDESDEFWSPGHISPQNESLLYCWYSIYLNTAMLWFYSNQQKDATTSMVWKCNVISFTCQSEKNDNQTKHNLGVKYNQDLWKSTITTSVLTIC